jgi:hypothetical protein
MHHLLLPHEVCGKVSSRMQSSHCSSDPEISEFASRHSATHTACRVAGAAALAVGNVEKEACRAHKAAAIAVVHATRPHNSDRSTGWSVVCCVLFAWGRYCGCRNKWSWQDWPHHQWDRHTASNWDCANTARDCLPGSVATRRPAQNSRPGGSTSTSTVLGAMAPPGLSTVMV